MDMQNVSNLTIPEGEVRTIHDKDSKLLWGRVNYDTKYAGDAVQDGTPSPSNPVDIQVATGEQTVTVTGKNLLNALPWRKVATGGGTPSPSPSAEVTITSSDDNNIAFTTAAAYRGVESNFVALPEGTTITVSFTGTLPNRFWITQYDENKTRVSTLNPSAATVAKTTVTTTVDGYVAVAFANAASTGSFNIQNIQLEKSSSATSYQPYQGQSYTIDLGYIELAKIGDYQDYIYKSGSDWYVHKETNSIFLNGSESWSRNTYVSGADIYGFGMTQTLSDIALANTSPVGYVADNFTALDSGQWNSNLEGIVQLNTKRLLVDIRRSRLADSEPTTFTTWLGENNIHLYYAIETPTDTKITDSILISQLDAIHQFLTRYGYSATVSGNLPIIIDRTAL